MKIEVSANDRNVTYTINNRTLFSVDVSDYQHGSRIESEDIRVGDHSIAIRLGRDNDMFMISAFRESGNQVCAKHLMVRLRDGDDIAIKHLGAHGGRELYGIRFGRNRDLYNEYGIRDSD